MGPGQGFHYYSERGGSKGGPRAEEGSHSSPISTGTPFSSFPLPTDSSHQNQFGPRLCRSHFQSPPIPAPPAPLVTPSLGPSWEFPTVSSWECRRRQRPGLCSGLRDLLLRPVKGPQVRSFQNINGITFWMRWRQTCLFDDGALKVSVAWK